MDRTTTRRLLAAAFMLAPFAARAQDGPTFGPLLIRVYPPGPRSRLDVFYARQNAAARRIIASVCFGCGVSLPDVTGARTTFVSLAARNEASFPR